VFELRIVENDCAPDLVVDDDFTVGSVPKANDRIHSLARLLTITATPVVSDLLTAGELPGTKFVKLPFRAVAMIRLALFKPFFDNRVVSFESPGLKKRTFVGAKTQPVQSVEYRLDVFFGRALAIGVFDTQDENALVVPRIKPAEQRRANAA
jgi:hypothetical protein